MPATYSPEGRIQAAFRKLDCSGRDFVALANSFGIELSNSTFAAKLKTGTLDHEIAETLREISDRMVSLQDSVSVPINWSKTDRVATALTLRLVADVAAEIDQRRNIELDNSASAATKLVQDNAT